MTNYAVIGAGFGDEGKGLMTDYLVRKLGHPVINVRCNGGAQAGHTVIDPANGYHPERRHVFSHVGAGTFAGAETWLSSRFIVNPFVLHQELDQLYKINSIPKIDVHPDALVTTVFDMTLNGLKELSRGSARHGSCGLGINETVTRALAGFPLTVNDLTNSLGVYKRMKIIYGDYWEPLLKPFRESTDPAIQELLAPLDLSVEIENLRRAPLMFNTISRKPSARALSLEPDNRHVVFEMAQGLELDEFLGQFPHVTRSITGLPSALLAAHEMGIHEITPVYVTRCYKTRHGAGPLAHEGKLITKMELRDETNVTGRWQGELRYAPLDVDNLYGRIMEDVIRSEPISELLRVKFGTPELAVTCLDQVGSSVAYYSDGHRHLTTPSELVNVIHTGMQVKYVSYGPSAKDVRELR